MTTKFLTTNTISNTSSRPSQDAISDGCGWRYYLCGAAATVGAILCHAACDGTALATTAGLGIPACVAACGTAQAYALVQCSDTYCK